MLELTEFMCQKGDLEFIIPLNKISEGEIDDYVENTLKSRFFKGKIFCQTCCAYVCRNQTNKRT